MQVTVEASEGLERRLKIAIPSLPIEEKITARMKELQRNASIKGFRPGKVPASILQKHYGEAVRYEILEEFIRESLTKALEQEKLNPAGMPNISSKPINVDDKLEYIATFEVIPDIQLTTLANAEFIKKLVMINEADVEKVLDGIRHQQANWQEVNRPATNEDRVTIDFEGTINNEKFEGGSGKGMQVVIGSKLFIAGFEEGLKGHKALDKFILPVTFPADYGSEKLRNQAAEFQITVIKVEEPILPEMNEEFIRKMGIADGALASLKNEVRANMQREMDERLYRVFKKHVINKLLELNPTALPKALVRSEIEHLKKVAVHQSKGRLKEKDLPNHLFRKDAEFRVHIGLVLNAVVKHFNIELDRNLVHRKLEQMASIYDDKEEVVNWYYQQQEMMTEVQSLVLEDQTVDKLLTEAKITEQHISYEEALAIKDENFDYSHALEDDEEHVHDHHNHEHHHGHDHHGHSHDQEETHS